MRNNTTYVFSFNLNLLSNKNFPRFLPEHVLRINANFLNYRDITRNSIIKTSLTIAEVLAREIKSSH